MDAAISEFVRRGLLVLDLVEAGRNLWAKRAFMTTRFDDEDRDRNTQVRRIENLILKVAQASRAQAHSEIARDAEDDEAAPAKQIGEFLTHHVVAERDHLRVNFGRITSRLNGFECIISRSVAQVRDVGRVGVQLVNNESFKLVRSQGFAKSLGFGNDVDEVAHMVFISTYQDDVGYRACMARYTWNIYRAIECAQKLLAPELRLRFRVKGHNVVLTRNKELIWESAIVAGSTYWDQLDHRDVARILMRYYSTPVSKLRRREVPSISSWHQEKASARLNDLQAILLAADKRLGKNLQSIWLFTEKSGPARKISYARISE